MSSTSIPTRWPDKAPRVVSVSAVDSTRLQLSFTDGTRGIVDLAGWVVGRGGVFTPLEDPQFFSQVRLTRSGGTVEWPNGADIDPDVLYSRLTGLQIPFADPGTPQQKIA